MNTEKSRELLEKFIRETPREVVEGIIAKIDAMVPPEEKYPELEEVADKIVQETVKSINRQAGVVDVKMPYRCQFVLEQVIKKLQELV